MDKVEEIIKLDLACGNRKKEGFIGVDIVKIPQVDIVYDLDKFPWDFVKDNSVDEINIYNYLEHVKDLMGFMNECYRIMKIGAKMFVSSPYYTSMRSMQDPTHVRPISEATFLYYNKKWREENLLSHYPITADFDYTFGYMMFPEWASRNEEAKAFAIRHYWNVAADIQVALTKR